MDELETPARVARIAVRRCLDALSYERIAQLFAFESEIVTPASARTCLERAAAALAPLRHAMAADSARAPYLCCDVVDHEIFGDLWLLVGPEGHVLYSIDIGEVRAMLAEFDGYFVLDATIVDEHLERANAIDDPWITTRRRFLHALDSDPALAKMALSMIRDVHRCDLGFATVESSSRMTALRQHCRPLLREFLAWCTAATVPTRCRPIDRAVAHALRHHDELAAFLRDARVSLHRPRVRPRIVEREVGCTFVSLAASCELHGLDPELYLHELLLVWPSWPRERALELSPRRWRATRRGG